MRLLTAVSGVRVPQQAPFERNRKSGFFLFYSLSSNPLTLFSPCTTFACRSDGENSLFRHCVPYGGSSPSTGARKAPCERCFFLALFEDKNPARFACFRLRRNDTADTALDAIGTSCSDRYSVTAFLTGVRVPCEGVTPSRSHIFIIKVRRGLRRCPLRSAQYYIKVWGRGA